MEIEKFVKWTVGLAAGTGVAIALAKHGKEIGDFLNGVSTTIVSFGQGIGNIG